MPHENASTPRSARPEAVGDVVRDRRRHLGLSQLELCARARIARRTLQRVEQGRLPASDTVWRLEKALGLEAGSLVPGWSVDASPHRRSIGARMRERRQALGLTLEEVAEYARAASQDVRFSASKLSRFERGVPRVERDWEEWDGWNRRAKSEIVRLLGFRNDEHFLDWLEGNVPDPPLSYG